MIDNTETYLESWQATLIEGFTKIVNRKTVNNFHKKVFIIDIRQGPKHTFATSQPLFS